MTAERGAWQGLRYDITGIKFTVIIQTIERAHRQGGPKNGTIFVHLIILSNINRFSKLFHCLNQETICNKTVIRDPTTSHVCRYTTL